MGGKREKAQLIERILEQEGKMYQMLHPIVPQEWLSVDLTMSQLKVALFLYTGGPVRMGILAANLGVSLATATGIVDRLVERNILVRETDPEDRRAIICRLSDEGRERMAQLWEMRHDRVKKFLERMAPSDLELVLEGMDAILQATRELEQETPSQADDT